MASYNSYRELSINKIFSLSIENAKSILEEVNQLIYQHDIAYHQKDTPVISDAEYDRLVQLSLAIENAFGPDIGETPLNSKYEGVFLLKRIDKSISKVAIKGP